jgi:lipid-A-disaccharide synthase
MKYYIIVGEASGDLHTSNLMKSLKEIDSKAEFRFWGGDLMQLQGGTLVKHISDLAFMGFVEVLMNIKTIAKNLKFCKSDILNFKPDVVILVDYPGFNLRIAQFVKQQNLKVFYYISPQIWAWKQSRIHQIKRNIDKMFVILPFEKDFYKKHNFEVDFSGHPLSDAISEYRKTAQSKTEFLQENNLNSKPIIALMPGSRIQEIKKNLPIMLSLINDYKEFQFLIAAAPAISEKILNEFTKNYNIKILYNKTYDILNNSTLAIVTSGTATLETALFNVPQVVCYKSGGISYQIAKKLIKVKYISLVNLIMDKTVVKELIQSDFNKNNLKLEMNTILQNEKYKNEMLKNYSILKNKVGIEGASKETAELMIKYLQN